MDDEFNFENHASEGYDKNDHSADDEMGINDPQNTNRDGGRFDDDGGNYATVSGELTASQDNHT